MIHTIYLCLGSNADHRMPKLELALTALCQFATIVPPYSSVYDTAPWGYFNQGTFLNRVVRVQTTLTPHQMLARCKQIEAELGRRFRGPRYGPRPVDIDILLYDDLVLNEGEDDHPLSLTIPHPRMTQRAFVMQPLAEFAPELRIPGESRTVREIADALGSEGVEHFTSQAILAYGSALAAPIGPRVTFEWGRRTYVMGIINVTPDSFSGDGVVDDGVGIDRAATLEAVLKGIGFLDAGVDILDVGGESTRPGGAPVTAEQEQARILPVIRALRAAAPQATISVDTYRAATAAAALAAGANWINDIGGLNFDDDMARVAAEANCPIVIMHNGRHRAVPARDGDYYGDFAYDDLLTDVCRELRDSVAKARAAGVRRENIILDPGIGFGKTVAQNLQLLAHLDRIKALGYPLLLGTSRKGFIGHVLGGLPADQRVEGTAATVALGIAAGADIVRVHDAQAMLRVARMTDAIVRQESAALARQT